MMKQSQNNNPSQSQGRQRRQRRRHIVVIVLGDVGRSPRMQYHTRSLLEQGHYVSLVGYKGEDLIPDLKNDEKWIIDDDNDGKSGPAAGDGDGENNTKSKKSLLDVVRFEPYSPPSWLKKYKLGSGGKFGIPIGLPIYLFLRLFGLLLSLVYTLWFRIRVVASNVDCILVQNPPSIPLLLISYLYCVTHTKIKINPSSTTTTTSTSTSTQRSKRKYQLYRPGLVIDWHNLGYTMFDTGPNHPISKIAKYYEQTIAPLSNGNLCVTNAMKEYLLSDFNMGIRIKDNGSSNGSSKGSSNGSSNGSNINVLHDRPPEFFHPTSMEVKHELMMRLRDEMERSCPELKQMRLNNATTTTNNNNINNECENENENESSTVFTKRVVLCNGEEKIVRQENQPALLISSTSWTPDEDFSILLDALVDLNNKLNKEEDVNTNANVNENINKNVNENKNDKTKRETIQNDSFPHLIVIVTGKGPQKTMYQSKIAKLNLSHISIITMWLEAKDYPLLLGCADLGISLHISTSGFDLPMKIYDFFGCEVPVCAVSFSCLSELVQDGVNGRTFVSSNELSSQIYELFNGKKRDDNYEDDGGAKLDGDLKIFRDNIRGISRWRENWIENAYDIILAACPYDEMYDADKKDN